MRVLRAMLALLACVVVAVAIGACGDDDDGGGGGGGASTGATSTPQASGLQQSTIDYGLKYTGGKAGKADASAEPFIVGWVNQEGGSVGYPEMTPGADAAVKFINEELGGMAGRPLQLDKCIIQAEEDGQKCAAQFLNNDKIMAVNYGLTVVGNKGFHETVTGKLPVIASWPGGPADYTTPGIRMLNGGALGTITAMTNDVKDSGAKTLSVVSSPNPAGKFVSEEIIKPQMDQAGIKTTIVYVADEGTGPDYVSALQASGGAKSDIIMSIPAGPQVCVFLYDALKTLNIKPKKVVATYYCYGDPMPEHTGGGPVGWDMYGPTQNQLIDSEEGQVYKDAMKTYTDNKYTFIGGPQSPFGDLLTLAKFVNTIGADKLSDIPAARKAIVDQLLAYTGPKFMIDGAIKCDANKDFISVCGDSSSGSKYDGSKWVSLGAAKVGTLQPEQFKETTSPGRPLPVPIPPKA